MLQKVNLNSPDEHAVCVQLKHTGVGGVTSALSISIVHPIARELHGIKQTASNTQSYAQLHGRQLRTLMIMDKRHTQVQCLMGWQHTLRSSETW